MSKRKFDEIELGVEGSKTGTRTFQSKNNRHTLDSDEEDEKEDHEELHADDIEGEEDGIPRQEEGHGMTAFNLREEMEEGHFDTQGHFIWKNEKEIRDNWLDNVDWQKIKSNPNSQYNLTDTAGGLGEDSDSSDTEAFDETKNCKEMLDYMKPGETVNKALNRLGGDNKKLSSVERLRRKKAGTLVESQDVVKLTALANDNLTALGNMNIYQETYESISKRLKNKMKPLEAEDDMFADDFDPNTKASGSKPEVEDDNNEVMWEFKWTQDDDDTVHGPHSSSQMLQWVKEGYFKSGVFVRKHGESSNFYTSSRIDFDLYI